MAVLIKNEVGVCVGWVVMKSVSQTDSSMLMSSSEFCVELSKSELGGEAVWFWFGPLPVRSTLGVDDWRRSLRTRKRMNRA